MQLSPKEKARAGEGAQEGVAEEQNEGQKGSPNMPKMKSFEKIRRSTVPITLRDSRQVPTRLAARSRNRRFTGARVCGPGGAGTERWVAGKIEAGFMPL